MGVQSQAAVPAGAGETCWVVVALKAEVSVSSPGDVHMVEVDVVLRGGDGDPVLAHPPDTDSDITLQEWLALMVGTSKGIKLDFKRYLNKKWLCCLHSYLLQFYRWLPAKFLLVVQFSMMHSEA